jgi:hypothetical protein
VVWLVVSRSSQSLFFECLASLNRQPKLVLLLTWGVCMLVAEESDSGIPSAAVPRAQAVLLL